jgi:hypothetical protein
MQMHQEKVFLREREDDEKTLFISLSGRVVGKKQQQRLCNT